MSRERTRTVSGGRRGLGALAGVVLVAAASMTPGCYTMQLGLLRSGLDSLRTQVDTLQVRDSVSYRVLGDLRREMSEQRDILLSTRASNGSTTQELFEKMGQLEGKLDEVMGRFNQLQQRAAQPPAQPSGPDPNQLYEQAAQDLTQGRYPLALQGFRDYAERFPGTDLADNALYGAGEPTEGEMRRFFAAQGGMPVPNGAVVRLQRKEKRWWVGGIDCSHCPSPSACAAVNQKRPIKPFCLGS